MMMLTKRLRRGFATQQRAAPSYPRNFAAHVKNQKLNAFNIGMAILTLSLSSQVVSYKNEVTQLRDDKKRSVERIEQLEKHLLASGCSIPEIPTNDVKTQEPTESLPAKVMEAAPVAQSSTEKPIHATESSQPNKSQRVFV